MFMPLSIRPKPPLAYVPKKDTADTYNLSDGKGTNNFRIFQVKILCKPCKRKKFGNIANKCYLCSRDY